MTPDLGLKIPSIEGAFGINFIVSSTNVLVLCLDYLFKDDFLFGFSFEIPLFSSTYKYL